MTRIDPKDTPHERASDLRHHLRNRLAAIRNAAFYIARKAEAHGLTQADARVESFLELIRKEVSECDEALTKRLTIEHLLGTRSDTTRKP